MLQDLVARQAALRPDATAIADGGGDLRYGELEALANRVARALREAGCRAGDRVALLLPRSPETIAAIIGILKADAIYVPLDPASPAPRVAMMLRSCEPRVVLASAATADLLSRLYADGSLGPDTALGWMDDDPREPPLPARFTREHLRALPSDLPSSTNGPDAPAYILFTSGSTGTPKGVVITHANVEHFVAWATDYFGMGPDDRVSGHAPLHFDLSTFDLFGTFAAGAELHPVPPGLNLLAPRLVEWIRARRLTQWFSVPSLLTYVAKFDVVREGDLPELRRLIWCGEVFPTPALRYWMERLPGVSFTNLYGPTEATVASSYYTMPGIPGDDSPVPIGRACGGEELLVLDDALESVPAGTVGHLHIRGVGVGPGYWRDDARTREVFLTDPAGGPEARLYRTGDLARADEDGLVHFVGRADSLIKSRGYRIELGEIEAALHGIDAVAECAVVGVPTDGFEGTLIGCAYTVARDADVSPSSLRPALAESLPDYMIPSRWARLRRLPRNANGKIDRPRLRELLRQPVPAGGRPAATGKDAS